MKINTSTYENLYNNIYKTISGLNGTNLRKDTVARNYKSFLEEGQKHLALAEIAKSKAKKNYKIFNLMQFNTNRIALENYAPIKELLSEYNAKISSLYPKTQKVRKVLTEMGNFDIEKTNFKMDEATKTLAKLKCFFNFLGTNS